MSFPLEPPADSPAQPKKYYLTTPIYYVNARPHLGHAYTTIVADVLARRHRLLGDRTFFLTGTDEHGQKIERSAAAAGVPPQQYADQVSASFRTLWDRMGLTYDRYIRTTDEAHKRGVQQLFNALYERGFIYLASYTGAYCVSDEAFVDVPVGEPCPDCGRLTESVTEENFFFKLSAFQRPLLDLIESNTLKVEPEARRNEVLSFLRGDYASIFNELRSRVASEDPLFIAQTPGKVLPASYDRSKVVALAAVDPRLGKSDSGEYYSKEALKDLSISRSSFTWGVPVPEAAASRASQPHVIYVWLDALANYMTAVGYGDPTPEAHAEFDRWWPADLHLVGKEIIRFHCVYWPAFLLALNDRLQHNSDEDPPTLPFPEHQAWAKNWLPKAITAHGWLLFDNSKMSKSKGNIVRTETILEAFGALCPPVPEKVAISPSSFRSEAEESASSVSNLSFRSEAEESASRPSPAPVRPPTPHERDLFATDVLRYFLLREIPFGQDGSFSFDAMVTRYNADLANGYGNLVSRTLKMIFTYHSGNIPMPVPSEASRALRHARLDYHFHLVSHDRDLADEYYRLLEAAWIDAANFSDTIQKIARLVTLTDLFLSEQSPWKVPVGVSQEEVPLWRSQVLYAAAEDLRIITALLYPILPFATARVWAQLGLGDIEAAAANGELNNLEWGGLKPGTRLGPLGPIFPRADKGLAQLMIDMENAKNTPTLDEPKGKLAPATEAGLPSITSQTIKTAETSQSAIKGSAAPPSTDATDSTDPAAPPRTIGSLDEPTGTLPVAGSNAVTTERTGTPSHTEAAASGVFAPRSRDSDGAAKTGDASPEAGSQTPQIAIDDFAKVEMRVAEILVAERIPKADKLLRLEVDLGDETRQILSGIAEWYSPEELIGRRIVVITNLAPRKMRGLESHGMLLAASDGEGGKPVLATFGEEIALGSRLR